MIKSWCTTPNTLIALYRSVHYKFFLSVMAVLWILQKLLGLVQFGIHQLLLQVFLLDHFFDVLEGIHNYLPEGLQRRGNLPKPGVLKTAHAPPLAVYTAHKASSAFLPTRRSLAGGWRSSRCAAPSESGCRWVWTENGLWLLSFSPPPDAFFARLHPMEGKTKTKKKVRSYSLNETRVYLSINQPRGSLYLERTVMSLQLSAQTLQLAASQDGLAVLVPEVVLVLDQLVLLLLQRSHLFLGVTVLFQLPSRKGTKPQWPKTDWRRCFITL